jgi:lipoate-protein ligase A
MGERGKSYTSVSREYWLSQIQSAEIKSKHGVILSCSLLHEGVHKCSVNEELYGLAKALEGKSYGFVNDLVEERTVGVHSADVWKWLKTMMEC